MDFDIDEIEKAALAATQGPWRQATGRAYKTPHVVDFGFPPKAPYAVCYGDDLSGSHNATFIAAANPVVVLSLIKRIRQLEAGRVPMADVARATQLLKNERDDEAYELLVKVLAAVQQPNNEGRAVTPHRSGGASVARSDSGHMEIARAFAAAPQQKKEGE